MNEVIKFFFYAAVAAVLVALIVWYTHHVWSDCLDENSFLTCMRMLNK